MIRVTIELIPHGVGPAKVIATADIANDGSSDSRSIGNYDATLFVHQTANGRPRKWRHAKVTGFPRIARGPWDLLQCVLADALGNRNSKGAKR